MNELRGKRVAIIVTDGFEQIEMTSPREALEKAGAKCVLVAPRDGEVQGFKHHDKADTFKVEMTLAQANAKDFDALMLPGGVINADAIRIDKKAQQFAQEIDRSGKPIAVICHGPWLLVSAGSDRQVKIWDARTGKRISTLPDFGAGVQAVALSADGACLVTADNSGALRVWDVAAPGHRSFSIALP